MKSITRNIPTIDIWPNSGQISGIPTNPRFIRDDRFDKLVKSIIDHPEMLHLRELIVIPYAGAYVAIAGNMRLRAAINVIGLLEDEFNEHVNIKKNKLPLKEFEEWFQVISTLRESKSIPCKVLPEGFSVAQIKAYIIKDNVAFGTNDYDLLANEWDEIEITDWGMELMGITIEEEDEEPTSKDPMVKIVIEFNDGLEDFEEIKQRVKDIILEFPTVTMK